MDLNTVTSLRPARSRADLLLSPGEAVLGGGTWIFSQPQPSTTGLVDLTTLGWQPWAVHDGGLSLAATCTIAQLLDVDAPVDWTAAPLLRQCAEAFLMSFKIWQYATIGGNVAMALPAGGMISLAVGLDATAVVWTPDGDERREPVADLVTGNRSTTLAAGEVIRSIEVPASALCSRTAFRKISLTSIGRSAAVVTGRLDDDGLTLAITAATPRPALLRFGGVPDDAALQRAIDGIAEWFDDAHGSPDWREAVTRVLAADVCQELRA